MKQPPHPETNGIVNAVAAIKRDLGVAHWALDYLEQLRHKW
jgi:hypothetical protein